ncbi:MAG TPA: phosphatidate cytidylyltransferase [Pyrinomonadaceae bacterium]|nr:phosphatidate cytidylyltransferase [Pyrinomonadaceae bacterium]
MKTNQSQTKASSFLNKIPPSVSRILTAAVLLPILIASILFEQLSIVFCLLVAVAVILGEFEVWVLARKKQIYPDRTAEILGSLALLVIFYFAQPGKPLDLAMLQLVLLLLIVGSLTAAMVRGSPYDRMLPSVGVTILTVMYVALLGGHLIAVRNGFAPALSRHLLSFFFLVIMGSDVAAYYGGRMFGRHKLAPTISPGKTWEGAIAGMLASLLQAAASHYWFFFNLPLKFALPLAAVMNVLGVLGDLTESALKRSAGAKDTAQILPGHGGVLDRIDSLLFNAPLIYYFAWSYFSR